MTNPSKLVGAVIQDPLEIEQGINYFLDYLTKNRHSELLVFSRGISDTTKIPSNLISNPYYLKFSKHLQINSKNQAVFQDYLGHIFIGDKDFPKRNKKLILEISNFSENTEHGLVQIVTNPESISASNIIYKNRNSN